jgi:hypothetical protein
MWKSGDRNENLTVAAACSATSTITVPPLAIFEGVTLNEDLMNEARFV